MHGWSCLIWPLSHEPTILITSHTATKKWAGLQPSTCVHTGTQRSLGDAYGGKKLESHKECFLLHICLGLSVPKEKPLKQVLIQTKVKTVAWEGFMRCFQKCCISCEGVQDVQSRRRRGKKKKRSVRRKRRWRRRVWKKAGVVPPAHCSVNDLSVWCKSSPCDAPAWAGAGVGRKEGREKRFLDRDIFNDPQGEVIVVWADVGYPGAGSLPPPPPPPWYPPPVLLPFPKGSSQKHD